MKKALKGGILAGVLAALIGAGNNFLIPRSQTMAEQPTKKNNEISDIIDMPEKIESVKLEDYNREQIFDLERFFVLKGEEYFNYNGMIFELSHKKKQNQKFMEVDISTTQDENYNIKVILPYLPEYFSLFKKIEQFRTRIEKERSMENLEGIYNEVLFFAAELKGIDIDGAKKLFKGPHLFEKVLDADLKLYRLVRDNSYFTFLQTLSFETREVVLNALKSIPCEAINKLLNYSYGKFWDAREKYFTEKTKLPEISSMDAVQGNDRTIVFFYNRDWNNSNEEVINQFYEAVKDMNFFYNIKFARCNIDKNKSVKESMKIDSPAILCFENGDLKSKINVNSITPREYKGYKVSILEEIKFRISDTFNLNYEGNNAPSLFAHEFNEEPLEQINQENLRDPNDVF